MLDAITRIEVRRLPNAKEKPMGDTTRAPFLPKNAVKWVGGSGLVLLAGALVLSAHVRSVLWGGWPFLVMLLCPLMHVFMHRGHGGHGGHGGGACHGGKDTAAPANANPPSATLKDEPELLPGDTANE
jgi:hypothetical protein